MSEDFIRQYAATRQGTDCSLICHAPTVNMNFEQNGNVRACCYNTEHVLGTWPSNSIREIWQGAKLKELRSYVSDNDLGGGCSECGKMLMSGNYHGVRARYYDEFAPDTAKAKLSKAWGKIIGKDAYPKVMEFELSNRCNLECVMCNGYFSSSIRKNREKLPAMTSPYDERFVDQLEEFIPNLTDAKFLGGEPFMIDIYLKIWERILAIKPSIRIHITTNGTLLTERVKTLLEGLRAGIILSIDSVNRDTYHAIRVNGNYDRVMENLEYFHDYTKRKGTFISMAACPITLNWKELPDMVHFCISRNIYLYFNAVFSPAEYSLRELPASELSEVVSYLRAASLSIPTNGQSRSAEAMSIKAYLDFVALLEGWLNEKQQARPEVDKVTLSKVNTPFVREKVTDWRIEEVRDRIQQYHGMTSTAYIDKETELLNRLSNLMIDTPQGQLSPVLMCYFELLNHEPDKEMMVEKTRFIEHMIERHPSRETILAQMGRSQPSALAAALFAMDETMLVSSLEQHFG